VNTTEPLQSIDERLRRFGRCSLLAFLLLAAAIGLVAETAHAKQQKARHDATALCKSTYAELHDPTDPFYSTDPAHRQMLQDAYGTDGCYDLTGQP